MRIPIPFDKELISYEDTMKNINYYLDRVQRGNDLLKINDKTSALKLLREINKDLKTEYHYYHLSKVEDTADKMNGVIFQSYRDAIASAYSKQVKKNSFEALSSNFYDIKDYLVYYKLDMENF